MAAAVVKCLWLAMAMFLISERAMLQAEAWNYGHATFYGGADASGTNNGACGYSNVFALGYGTLTAALSTPLFNNGLACGACFQVMCSGSSSCYGNSITVTGTNLCPQGSFGGWCDYPNDHFDLSQPAFSQIASTVAGHVDVQYQRVACVRSGGIKFQAQGHTYFLQVLIYNVGGMGDVTALSVQGNNAGFNPMFRGWGQVWQTASILDGQSLSFGVTTSDGKTVTSNDVCSQSWQYGQTFVGSQF